MEVILSPGPSPKFRRRMTGDVDLVAESGLGFREGASEVCESTSPIHQEMMSLLADLTSGQ
jgi:hypothetical protein